MSTLEVNKIIPQGSGTALQIGENGDTITLPAGTVITLPNGSITNDELAGSIANAKLANSTITINGSSVALGGSVTVGSVLTFPTIGSINPSTIENTQTAVTITGTNYISVPFVDAINSSTGAIVSADSVSFTNGTTIVATFTLPVDGTYFLRVENNDGLAVRSGSALLTVSDAPAWQTAAGSLGSFAAGATINVTVSATSATAYAVQSGSLPGGLSLNTSTGVISGTESGASSATTYNFTIRATDAQAQTADRAFSIAITVGFINSLRFA
tara:strand:+ start:2938 stop:3750 length:813 start_codon:yes stop_codon:yes gene_type:complete